MKTFVETFYEDNISANRMDEGSGIATYDPVLAAKRQRKAQEWMKAVDNEDNKRRHRKREEAQLKMVDEDGQSNMVHIEVQHPSGKWMRVATTQNDSQIYLFRMQQLKQTFARDKRIRVVDQQGHTIDIM